jgi:hypothetical protein
MPRQLTPAIVISLIGLIGAIVVHRSQHSTNGAVSPMSKRKRPDIFSCDDVSAGTRTIKIGYTHLTYCEGKSGIEFQWEPRGEVDVLFVPSPRRWPVEFPEWTHGRREEIIGTIQSLGAARKRTFVPEEYG